MAFIKFRRPQRKKPIKKRARFVIKARRNEFEPHRIDPDRNLELGVKYVTFSRVKGRSRTSIIILWLIIVVSRRAAKPQL